ncbi:hypothetical protein XENTR_v10004463 [Xenopus tropicalis]|uniref:Uncharacterized LOC105945276 n=1 Tax=Xenopus tropicalis TaxID=8364 RepID=A0A1B8Y6Y4_XENTR|nr:uncharacterized protein LOC105945276 [Xenopus tropicalis]KAE8577188.1 hypothetical protein XENTR_v10004463 [Xenopus tropicalis]|eukprot:XP_012808328.1 PREDICTED: uncharacterized protein LOC105945276 [Xenopus tropicalis]
MARPRAVGRCPVLFILAFTFDASGIGLILAGIFANLEKNGRSFGEFLIYSGGILVFFSLLLWLAWYSFNLEVSMEELIRDSQDPPRRNNLVQLARKVSESISKRSKRKVLSRDPQLGAQPCTPNQLGDHNGYLAPPAFINKGFTNQLDIPTPIQEEKPLELSSISSPYGYPVTRTTQVMAMDRLV